MLDRYCLQDRPLPQGDQVGEERDQDQLQRGSGDHQRGWVIRSDESVVHPKWDSQHIFDARARKALQNHLRQLGGILSGAHAEGNGEVPQG